MDFIPIAHAGIITDAPSISDIGIRILNFLLSSVAIFAIIALLVAGILYLISNGDAKKIQVAKRAINAGVVGVAMALGGMILVKFIGQFFGK